jgi:sugar phosphate isomerase/epimerase
MPDAADLSVQLYTVRRALDEDPDGTLADLAEIGFRTVEAFDLIAWRERLRESLRRHGLAVPTAHVEVLATDAATVADAAHDVGVTTVIQPWTDPERWRTAGGVAALADALAGAADTLAAEGLRVGYHNHHFELASMIDGRHALEVFAERLPDNVVLEVDAYWAFAGGADVPALLERLGDRVVALHIKDGDGSLDTSRQVAAGRGTVPIPAILAAAPDALRVIELDDTAGDLLGAVRDGREYLVGLAGG